jgi:hypothetical protein
MRREATVDRDTVWRHIDTQRREVAELIDTIDARDPDVWDTPSPSAGGIPQARPRWIR